MDNHFDKQSDAIANGTHFDHDNTRVIGMTDDTVIYRRVDETGRELPVTVVCMNHSDIGIDDFVNELEQPPDLYKLDSVTFTAWETPKTCKYCSEKPVLLIV